MEELRKLFLGYLTKNGETKDARRKDFNQAIFTPYDGTFNEGDKAVRTYSKGKNRGNVKRMSVLGGE